MPKTSSKKKVPDDPSGIHAALEFCRKQIEAGEAVEIFDTVLICAEGGIPFPQWLTELFRKAREDYFNHRVKTLDDAFGVNRLDHYRQDKAREVYEKSVHIYHRCLELRGEGVKIGAAEGGLFQKVGDEYGICESKVRDYYYHYRKLLAE